MVTICATVGARKSSSLRERVASETPRSSIVSTARFTTADNNNQENARGREKGESPSRSFVVKTSNHRPPPPSSPLNGTASLLGSRYYTVVCESFCVLLPPLGGRRRKGSRRRRGIKGKTVGSLYARTHTRGDTIAGSTAGSLANGE